MKLSNYLKQFKNIAWYPSALKDSLSMVCLSHKSLREYGIKKDEAPDCFIFTDYATYADQADNQKFFLDLDEYEDETNFYYNDKEFKATALNIRELDRIKLPFDQSLVEFERDNYYGRVFVADILLEHPEIGKTIAKLVYVIAENTAFAFDFLIKNGIKVKYAIHSRYGHGFGGGISNGAFMCHILADLGTKYFASDINDCYGYDVADEYLTGIQRNTLPVLKKIVDFAHNFNWCGYDNTILYEVKGFKRINDAKKDGKRILFYKENDNE